MTILKEVLNLNTDCNPAFDDTLKLLIPEKYNSTWGEILIVSVNFPKWDKA